jgi:hypothetical protein
MAIGTHAGKDIGSGMIEVNQNIAGVALLGIGQKIDVITLLVTCAQKAHHRSTHQLTRIPHSFSWTRLSCGAVNQADEVESIGHGRELTADSVPGKKESAIEHGDENAIEAPRNYNEFSVNGNKPLNSVSQSRGALQNRALGPAPLLAYLSPHGLSPLRGCALPTLAKTNGGTSPLQVT